MSKLPVPTESQEQIKLFQWLRIHGIRAFHVPNEGKRAPRADFYRKLGIVPGVPDVLITTPAPYCKTYRGVAIELKRTTAGPSAVTAHQERMLESLKHDGWLTRVCFGADEAIEWLKSLGFGER